MSENAQILLVIWSFWIVVVGLDIFALVRIRRLALGPTASVLWTAWIVVVPVIGAVTSFIVLRPTADAA